METSYQALVVRRNDDTTFSYGIEARKVEDLPEDEVLIRVCFSTINFKDCMSCQGNPAVTQKYPHTPGIDAAGVVESSSSAQFKQGDRVVVISSAMGMTVSGGFGQYIRVPEKWVMSLDDEMDLEEAMAFGTAGYTAALSVEAIQEAGITLEDSKILVTGATGGVGCVSVALLSQFGCHVTAVTGKLEAKDFLLEIGATKVLDRSKFEKSAEQSMLVPRWDAAIDVAGGNILSTVLKMIRDNGVVIATGMVKDASFEANVMPFILRSIKLIGVNAENTDMARRRSVWKTMMTSWKPKNFSSMYKVVTLQHLPSAIDAAINSQQVGRIVVDMR
jgi:acrylyl-CoA reductase (NADPH)